MSWGYGVFLRLLCLAAGYLFGCFLTAEVVARCTAGESARQIGSGNPGMANIMTHLGKRAGLLVLAGDVLKTAAACWFCWQLAPELRLTALLYGGFGAVLGHNWPFWNHGHGGKGVAVTCAWADAVSARHRGAVLPCGRHCGTADRLPATGCRIDRGAGRAGRLAAVRRRGRYAPAAQRCYHAGPALGGPCADVSRRGAAVFPPEALIL